MEEEQEILDMEQLPTGLLELTGMRSRSYIKNGKLMMDYNDKQTGERKTINFTDKHEEMQKGNLNEEESTETAVMAMHFVGAHLLTLQVLVDVAPSTYQMRLDRATKALEVINNFSLKD